MTRPLDPSLLETVTALIDGLEHATVRHCLIGALVPELLLVPLWAPAVTAIRQLVSALTHRLAPA